MSAGATVTHIHKHEHGHEHDHEHDHDHDYEHAEAKCKCGEGGSYMDSLAPMLLAMCQKQGIDPGLVAMMEKDKDGMFGGSGLLVLLFLIILMGGRGFGFGRDGEGHRDGGYGYGGYGGGYGGPGVVNQIDFKVLLDAIERKGLAQEIAMKELATNLHINFDTVKMAIGNLDKGVGMLGGEIKFLDSNIRCAIKECCCQTALNIERAENHIQKDIFCLSKDMDKSFCHTDALIDNRFCALERRMDEKFCKTDALIVQLNNDNRIRELEERNADLRDRVFNDSQNAQTERILRAIKCEPRNVCFPEERPCRDRDRDERR